MASELVNGTHLKNTCSRTFPALEMKRKLSLDCLCWTLLLNSVCTHGGTPSLVCFEGSTQCCTHCVLRIIGSRHCGCGNMYSREWTGGTTSAYTTLPGVRRDIPRTWKLSLPPEIHARAISGAHVTNLRQGTVKSNVLSLPPGLLCLCFLPST